jgi:hypothetical protein
MRGLRNGVLACGFAAVLASVGSGSALEMRPILTLDVARKIVDGCWPKPNSRDGRCTSRCSTSAAI